MSAQASGSPGDGASERPLRVLATLPWGSLSGGAEAMLQALIEGSARHGYELDCVFLEPGPWAAQLAAAGHWVQVIDAGRVRQPHRWLRAIVQLARTIRARAPDLILNWSAKPQLYGAPAAVLAGRRGSNIWWQHAVPEHHWMDVLATRLPAREIGATSRYAAAAQSRLRPVRPMFVVPAGTAEPPAGDGRGPDLAAPAGVPVVGIVGRLQAWKGQDRLLRAQALLRERGQDMRLVVVGGPSFGLERDYAASLPGLIEQLGLTDAVTMTGEVPDAGPYVSGFDVLVNASDPEPFGIVLLEAMARGVATLAVARGGPLEIVEDGVTGVLARSGEPAALADALAPLLASAELRATLGAAGRERYLRDFTEEAMCARFAAEMRRLAGSRVR